MPRAIDVEALESPNMQILDLGAPPTKNIPYMAFPKAIYLHPKDKSKTHRIKIVETPEELEAADKIGYKTNPHIPVEPTEDLTEHFEAETPKSEDPIDSMTKPELLAEAEKRGITVKQTDNKPEIIAALKAD